MAWIDQRMESEPRVAAYVLGGLFGAPVDERRRALVEEPQDRGAEGMADRLHL